MQHWRDITVVAGSKAAVGAVVLLGGFTAVSDDDFARVVHAQQWALEPRLDPTSTSWLPLPFWVYGSAMKLFGPSLAVARSTAFILGVASALLIYAAARLLLTDRRDAVLGAVLAALLPWSARLGVATVPELPTAALALFAVATLVKTERRVRWLGAAALFAACLSRYEPWPIAAIFAAMSLWDARRDKRLAGPAFAAVVGPLAWVAHNAVTHGSAFHFLASVRAYQQAVSTTAVSYPAALLREEPEICVVGAALLVSAMVRRSLPTSLSRVSVALGGMLATLTIAALPGGAPTHHAGRVLLVVWLAMAIYVGAGVRAALRDRRRHWFALLVLAVLPMGQVILRPWYARLDGFIDRSAEIAIGERAAEVAGRERVLLEVLDYGFFAVQAGSGNPDLFVVDRSIDPRKPRGHSSFGASATIRQRAARDGVEWVVARVTPVTNRLGSATVEIPPWGIWRLSDPSP